MSDHKTIAITPVPVTEVEGETISLYAAHEKIYPHSVKGFFTRWRWFFIFLTQAIFYGLPWLQWQGRQAVLFDLSVRKFYLFGLVLYPQDLIYLTALLVISALALFLFTAVAGRLWCGFTCPQTVYTEIFMWIERQVEGDRIKRLRLDAGSWTGEKIAKKLCKHFLWIALALWTGFTFVGYFTPIIDLAQRFSQWDLGSWEVFWTFFYGFATYGNAGWMREQVCKYMCPYARFQSAMFDRDTLIVSYDEQRGEPRGKRGRSTDLAAAKLGSCIDCQLCVHVCPTGIDIRKGLQYECINCAACVDVCNGVMDKMHYPRGLIRFTTENALSKAWTQPQIWRQVFRPRVLIYTAILWAIILATGYSLVTRAPFKVDVVRDRGNLGRIEGNSVENVYQLQIMNASDQSQTYQISVTGLPGLQLATAGSMSLGAAAANWFPLRLQMPIDSVAGAKPGTYDIEFHIQLAASDSHTKEKSTFIVPR